MKFFLLAISVFSLDVLTKWAATIFLQHDIFVFSFFRLSLHHNTGLAFSLPLASFLQLLLSGGLMIVLGIFFIREQSIWKKGGIAVILGGALGNFGERLFWGSVTDFLAFFSFPIFNIADTAIFLGVVALFLAEVFLPQKTIAKKKER